MLVSFLIPLYNGLALTRACLISLQETLPAGLKHEIIFIDDGSTDGTREWLATLAAPCQVILNDGNLGYAASNNRGARAARGEFLALLNNDLELLPGWLEPMLAALRRNPKLALVGNVQRRKDDHAVDHAGIEFGADAKLRHRRVLPAAASIRRRPVRRVAAVTAACCLVRRAAFLGARGGFDTGYRNGAEDVDLCLRLASQGHRVAVVLNSEVYHHVSASRGVTAEHNEANSRRLFTLWREELITLGARTWARETLARARREPGQVDGRTRLAALGTLLPGRKPTRRARYEITTAIFLEELHWNHAFSLPEPKPPTDHRLYHLDGLLPDDIERGTWSTRERFKVKLPAWVVRDSLFVFGTVLPPTPGRPETQGRLGLRVIINGVQHLRFFPLADRPFSCGTERVLLATDEPVELTVEILGTAKQNFLAWLGRRTAPLPLPRAWRAFLQAHRPQPKNRRIRIAQIAADGRAVYDFGLPQPLNLDRGHRSLRPPGLNVVGWFRAELGLGESARCMARACEAADVPAAFIDMKLPCLNRGGDDTFTTKLQTTNPYHVNVVHLDPPATPEFDRYHGEVFRRGRRNIAYWAWELAEFPDEWVPACAYFQEIWCPSAFVRDAIAAKVPLPVIVMPHAIGFEPPGGDQRPRFGLPADRFLFLFLYDLNSYQERKNPLAVIEAYRRAFPDEAGVALVIKTQNRARNPGEYARLEEAVRGLAHVTLIADTLSREDVHALEAACDCFVSLHRSEGFGLAVAECMHLGKPVIATDWSATAEFVSHDNGRPIPWREIEITETHGPYRKGQRWADPEVDAAAAAMRELAGDPALARRLGEAARRTIAERFAPAVIGRRYQARLDAMRLWLG